MTSVHVENGEGFLFRDSEPFGKLNFDVDSKNVFGKISFQTKNISLNANFKHKYLYLKAKTQY